LENEPQQIVEPIAEVDRHDVGSREINIFILADDLGATFERVIPLLSNASLLDKISVAYRALHCDGFMLLWPPNSTGAFVVA
jgi:hypothetical protein